MRTASTIAVLVAAAALLSPAAQASTGTQPWTDVPVPLPAGGVSGALNDISTLAANDAWAVGSWKDTATHPLAVHWDGTRWTDVPIDDRAAPGRYRLAAVDAVAAGDVWAVGSVSSAVKGGPDTALVLHFTNGAWQQPMPVPQVVAGALKGIDMVSATEGWAVGEGTAVDNSPHPIVLRYQSGAWSPTAVTLPAGARLTSVFGAPAGQAWAVGSYQQPAGDQGALIAHWDGSAWRTQLATTGDPATFAWFNRVGGWSTTDAWAVGTVCQGSTADASNCGSLAMHLSRGTWKLVPTAGGAELTGIVAHTPTNIWLAGYAALDPTTDTDHVVRWDGTTLTPDDTVHTTVRIGGNLGQLGSALAAAAPDHTGGLWAVGWIRRDGNTMPSALHRT